MATLFASEDRHGYGAGIMRSTHSLLVAVMVLTAVLVAEEVLPLSQETDFSGYWAQDDDASLVETTETLAGLAGGGAPEDIFVSQARDGTLVISSRHNPSQPRVYSIGGDSLVPAPGEQGGTMRLTTRWRDGALVSEGSVATGGDTLRVSEILSLSDDGNTLVLEATMSSAAGEVSNRLVYRRWSGR
jgi:hypothetical protein